MKNVQKKNKNWKHKITCVVLFCLVIIAILQVNCIETKAAGGITIDGYYDDWEGIPKTMITYYSNNQLCNNHAALVRDGEYLYLYVEMHPLYISSIPIDAYYLHVNGKQLPFFLRYPTADRNGIDWGKNVNLSKDGIYTGLSPFTYYPAYSWGDAAVTVSSGDPNDRFEVRMKISEVEKLMGLEQGTIASGVKVEVTMPNVGGGKVTMVGTSTGAFFSILLMAGAVVLFGLLGKKKGLQKS